MGDGHILGKLVNKELHRIGDCLASPMMIGDVIRDGERGLKAALIFDHG